MEEQRADIVDCPHGEACGACTSLGVDYGMQLIRKTRALEAALAAYRPLSRIEVLDCLESPEISGYRNRAKMAVGMSSYEPTKLGYFSPHSREIVDAPECRVLKPAILRTARSLRQLLRSRNRMPKELRHIDIRCGSDPNRQHMTLVMRSKEMPHWPLEAFRKASPQVDGISVNLNPSAGPQVIRGPVEHQWGAREVYVDVGELSLRVSANSFSQVNLGLLPTIHRLMGEFFEPGGSLLDLYAGVGTHGLALCSQFDRVTAIEGVRSSVADAKATIKRYRLGHVRMVPKPVERSLQAMKEAAAESVILNPSRAGAKEIVLDALCASPAQQIVYLSCEPKTLSRDLDRLVQGGFRLLSAQPIDMMPQTRQVEAIAMLRRR